VELTAPSPGRSGRALDLGSGAGLPGLPLVLAGPELDWTLLDGSRTRAAFLEHATRRLRLDGRVQIVAERAETAARGPRRASFDVVVARSFGPPAVTAECAAPFLREGGRLIVAEPPGGQPERWDADGLAQLGLVIGPGVSRPTAYQVLVQRCLCPDRFPRRVGVPAKRPLF
jgi:16S rRNA (guanine527-N7)-methyltransferase